ncbi:MAG: TonB-dependent receptor [Haliscomenobacter sp.]|nr:TonB-dependent receptor [Haliscomenobacter sp.]
MKKISLLYKGAILSVLSFLPLCLPSQECHLHLYGYVRDASGSSPISYVTVFIEETGNGTLADEKGYFHLEGLCPGASYTVQCTRLGYQGKGLLLSIQSDTGVVLVMQEIGLQLERVEVNALKAGSAHTQAAQSLQGTDLEAGKALGFGESLRRLVGVTTLNTGATIAKPVIQGLHSNRILILNNGVRQESQQWGSEHAPEIDPFLAQEITVIKGAGSVRYGSDALGGVILVQPAPLPKTPGAWGEINLQGMSNGRTGIASGRVEARLKNPKFPLSGRVQGTLKRGGNIRTPDYFLRNTGISEANFSWTARLEKERWNTDVFYSRFYTQLGILRDAHIGNLTDLENAIARGRPLEDGAFSYTLGRPQQQVVHELVKWKTQWAAGESSLFQLQFSRQFNRRQEYDAHKRYNALPENVDEAQIQLEITTYRVEADWEHQWAAHVEGNVGLNYMAQTNTTDRGGLLPRYDNNVAGAYWIERWKRPGTPLELELGMRYDIQHLTAGPLEQAAAVERKSFKSWSGALGAVYSPNHHLTFRANTGSAWRAPHVSELFSEGVHHGSASYEQGTASLQSERAWNTSLTLEWTGDSRETALTVMGYYNLIRDYIFLEPMDEPVLTIRGAFPAFRYSQANARLTGIDARFSILASPRWLAEFQASVINGWNTAEKDYLVFMPPSQFRYSLRYKIPAGKDTEKRHFLQVSAQHVLKQRWVPAGADYAPPPDGYLRLDVEGSFFVSLGRQPVELGFSILNALNTEYRDYLNRLRYFAAEPGRNLLLRVRIPFQVALF